MLSIADFNQRVTVKRWTYTQTATGKLNPVLAASWEKWAKVENRGGSQRETKGREWDYTHKITLRYENARVERAGNTVEYNGLKLQIENISFLDEGTKRYVVLRCSTTDELGQAVAYVNQGFTYTLPLLLA